MFLKKGKLAIRGLRGKKLHISFAKSKKGTSERKRIKIVSALERLEFGF